jgi:hypothetical protein
MIMAKKMCLPSHTEPLSAAQMVQATGLEAEARSLAVGGLPLATETQLSKGEAAVVELGKSRIDLRHHEVDAADHDLRARLAELPDDRTDGSARTLDATVSQGVMEVFQTYSAEIRDKEGKARSGGAEFKAFRQKNRLLEHTCRGPVSQVRHWAFVGGAGVGEAGLASGMYLPSTGAGAAGAMATALMVAICVIGPSVAAGYFPARYLALHDLPPDKPNRRRNTRLWAIPALVVASLLVVFVALFAGHYREVGLATEGAFDQREVLQQMLQHPLSLSLASFGLFVVSLLAALFAGRKAYTSTDYPGYARETRRYAALLADRDDLKTYLHGQLDAVRHTHVDGLFNRTLATRDALEEMRKQHAMLSIKAMQTARLDASDQTAMSSALLQFRRINRDVRADAVPAYFDKPIDLSHLVPKMEIDDLGEKIEAATEAHAAHTEDLLNLVDAQMQRINRAKDRVEVVMSAIHRTSTSDTDLPRLDMLRRLIDGNDVVASNGTSAVVLDGAQQVAAAAA